MWEFLLGDRWTKRPVAGIRGREIKAPLRQPMRYEVLLPEIVKMTQALTAVENGGAGRSKKVAAGQLDGEATRGSVG